MCEGTLEGGLRNGIRLGNPALCSETLFLPHPHPHPQSDISRWRKKMGRQKEKGVTGEEMRLYMGSGGNGGHSAQLETGRSTV